MKIRLGHVSNSSSTSFSVYGIALGEEYLPFHAHENLLEEMGLEAIMWCGLTYIGLEISSVEDEETKCRAEKLIISFLEHVGIDCPREFCLFEEGYTLPI